MTYREQGAAAFRDGVAYEANPYVPGGPAVAELCRLHDWPEEAQEWHRGWSGEARSRADAASTNTQTPSTKNALT